MSRETPMSDEAIRSFPLFTDAVSKRLDRGRRDYGDSSFTKPMEAVLDELAAECLDLAGWGFILWTRIQKAIDAARSIADGDQVYSVPVDHEGVGAL